jgi:hypothetical protein
MSVFKKIFKKTQTAAAINERTTLACAEKPSSPF